MDGLPRPLRGEPEQTFINRAMQSPEMFANFPEPVARLAKAVRIWMGGRGGDSMEHDTVRVSKAARAVLADMVRQHNAEAEPGRALTVEAVEFVYAGALKKYAGDDTAGRLRFALTAVTKFVDAVTDGVADEVLKAKGGWSKQPRVGPGSPKGGQWTSHGGTGGYGGGAPLSAAQQALSGGNYLNPMGKPKVWQPSAGAAPKGNSYGGQSGLFNAPQYGLKNPAGGSYGGFENPLPDKPKPTAPDVNAKPKNVAVYAPGIAAAGKIGSTPFSSWKDAPTDLDGWANVDGQRNIVEPAFVVPPGKRAGSGVIIEEADGRVWIVEPTKHYGGYENTFPKGGVEPGLSLQAGAIKEAFEESGLKVEIKGFAMDVDRTTSYARYYLARRTGGTPADAHWETQGVRLVPKDRLPEFLNHPADKPLVDLLTGVKKALSPRVAAMVAKALAAEAKPPVLFAGRFVQNTADLIAWAKQNGIGGLVPADEMHVTVAFSREPVSVINDDEPVALPPESVIGLSRLGDASVVLRLDADQLHEDYWRYRDAGATWDFESYSPHMTLSYQDQPLPMNVTRPPWIILGPIIEEVPHPPVTKVLPLRAATTLARAMLEVAKKNKGAKGQPRVPKGSPKGGEWTTWGSGSYGGLAAGAGGAFEAFYATGANPNNSALVSANKAITAYAAAANKGDLHFFQSLEASGKAPQYGGNTYTKMKAMNYVEAKAYAKAKADGKFGADNPKFQKPDPNPGGIANAVKVIVEKNPSLSSSTKSDFTAIEGASKVGMDQVANLKMKTNTGMSLQAAVLVANGAANATITSPIGIKVKAADAYADVPMLGGMGKGDNAFSYIDKAVNEGALLVAAKPSEHLIDAKTLTGGKWGSTDSQNSDLAVINTAMKTGDLFAMQSYKFQSEEGAIAAAKIMAASGFGAAKISSVLQDGNELKYKKFQTANDILLGAHGVNDVLKTMDVTQLDVSTKVGTNTPVEMLNFVGMGEVSGLDTAKDLASAAAAAGVASLNDVGMIGTSSGLANFHDNVMVKAMAGADENAAATKLSTLAWNGAEQGALVASTLVAMGKGDTVLSTGQTAKALVGDLAGKINPAVDAIIEAHGIDVASLGGGIDPGAFGAKPYFATVGALSDADHIVKADLAKVNTAIKDNDLTGLDGAMFNTPTGAFAAAAAIDAAGLTTDNYTFKTRMDDYGAGWFKDGATATDYLAKQPDLTGDPAAVANEIVAQSLNVDTAKTLAADGLDPNKVIPMEYVSASALEQPKTISGVTKLSEMTYVGAKTGGSAKGGWYVDGNGQQYLIKKYPDAAQAQSEVLASKLYMLGGVAVPDMKTIVDDTGQFGVKGGLVIASAKVDDFTKMNTPAGIAETRKNFATSAWLADWDVIGQSFDNTVITTIDGKAMVIDPGGALEYRAMGDKKGAAFGTKVTEIDTLRDPAKNPQAAAVFGGMAPTQIYASMNAVAAIPDSLIKDTVMQFGPGSLDARAALADKLIARKADIVSQQAALGKKIGYVDPPPGKVLAEANSLYKPGPGDFKGTNYDTFYKGVVDSVEAAALNGDVAKLKAMTESFAAKADASSYKTVKNNYGVLGTYASDAIKAIEAKAPKAGGVEAPKVDVAKLDLPAKPVINSTASNPNTSYIKQVEQIAKLQDSVKAGQMSPSEAVTLIGAMKLPVNPTQNYAKKVATYANDTVAALGGYAMANSSTTAALKAAVHAGAVSPTIPGKVDPSRLSAPLDFINWKGQGQGLSSHAAYNQQNQMLVNEMKLLADKGDVKALENFQYQPIDQNGNPVGGLKSITQHTSQHVSGYAQQLVNEIKYQLNPPKKVELDPNSVVSSIHAKAPVQSVKDASAKIGYYLNLGSLSSADTAKVQAEVDGWSKLTYGNGLSTSTYSTKAMAAFKKLPTNQQQAIQSYTGGSYHTMNQKLWGGNPTGEAAAAKAGLKVASHEVAVGTVLSRKLSLNPSVVSKIKPGTILQEPAIGSSSIKPTVWSGSVQYRMHVGPGVKALYAGPFSHHSGEVEMILQPDLRMVVLKKSSPGDAGFNDHGFGSGGVKHVIDVLLLPS